MRTIGVALDLNFSVGNGEEKICYFSLDEAGRRTVQVSSAERGLYKNSVQLFGLNAMVIIVAAIESSHRYFP